MLSRRLLQLPRHLASTPKPAPRGLYLDYQATTQIDYRVLDAMLPFMTQMFGNPHSKTQYKVPLK